MRDIILAVLLVGVILFGIVYVTARSATSRCEELIAVARTHADTVVVYSSRVSQYASPCMTYLTK